MKRWRLMFNHVCSLNLFIILITRSAVNVDELWQKIVSKIGLLHWLRSKFKLRHDNNVSKLNSLQCVWDFSTPPPHHNRFTALFPGPPGSAGARRELLDFMVQGKINRGRHTDHPAGGPLHPDWPVPTSTIPPFFTGRMPFLPSNQQCQSTEGN